MGYRYKNYCLDTVSELHDVISSDCPSVTSDGAHILICTPSSNDITVSLTEIATGTTTTRAYTPELIACDTAPAIAEIVELSWLVIGVWVVAWTFKKMADAIRGRS